MPTIEAPRPRPLTMHLTPALDSAERLKAYLQIAKNVLPENLLLEMLDQNSKCIGHLRQEISKRVHDFIPEPLKEKACTKPF